MGALGPDLLTGESNFYSELPEIAAATIGIAIIVAFCAVLGLIARWLGWHRRTPQVPERERVKRQA
jgi:hypothetical protein